MTVCNFAENDGKLQALNDIHCVVGMIPPKEWIKLIKETYKTWLTKSNLKKSRAFAVGSILYETKQFLQDVIRYRGSGETDRAGCHANIQYVSTQLKL